MVAERLADDRRGFVTHPQRRLGYTPLDQPVMGAAGEVLARLRVGERTISPAMQESTVITVIGTPALTMRSSAIRYRTTCSEALMGRTGWRGLG